MMKATIKACAIQVRMDRRSAASTVRAAFKLVEKAARRGPEIICLPEHWVGQSPKQFDDSLLKGFSSLAEEYSVAMVPGVFLMDHNGKRTISSPVIDSKGQLAGRQDKIHLFKQESELASGGLDLHVLDLEGFRVGVMVCYDGVFPEVARILALKEADILLCPSRIVRQGVSPWKMYLRVRSLENRIPIVACNLVSPPRYNGHSVIAGLFHDRESDVVHSRILTEAGSSPQILIKEVDLEVARQLRAQRFKDRRPESYHAILS